jgi:magnesium-protoporphyrin O-methyltransferase
MAPDEASSMSNVSYAVRRGELETYFDRTAADAWARLTSDAPVSGIRATVRAGRDRMRATLLSWLPENLAGVRILDAGCGTGALSIEAARRGAHVTAIDLSATLVGHARERATNLGAGHIDFHVGDMMDPALGTFDHVVGMDSLIHYRAPDMARVVAAFAARTRGSVLFTFAPFTPLLGTMLTVGKLFPRSDRSPAVEPVSRGAIAKRLTSDPALAEWRTAREKRITASFYMSHALEMVRR